ncbi:hypothetical protein [Gangjinia marincola]
MKKLLFLGITLVTIISFAQEADLYYAGHNYYMLINITGNGGPPDDYKSYNAQPIVRRNNNSILFTSGTIGSGGSAFSNKRIAVPYTGGPYTVKMGGYVTNWVEADCPSCSPTDYCSINSTNCGSNNTAGEQTKTLSLFGSAEWGNSNSSNLTSSSPLRSYSKVWLLPKIRVDASNNERSLDDQVFDVSGQNISDGQWYYFSNADGQYIPLTNVSVKNKFPMNITLQQLDDMVVDDILAIGNVKLQFRLSSSGGGVYTKFQTGPTFPPSESTTPGSSELYFDTYILDVIKASPAYSTIAGVDTSCVYTTDGGFELDFQESLTNVSILFVVSSADGVNFSYSATINGTAFNWSESGIDLPPGTYTLTYQEQPSSQPVPKPGDPPIVFTIGTPSPVEFTTSSNDLNCFEQGAGNIYIDASGGTGSLEYSLDNGVTYSALSSNPMTITGLSIGEYDVRVRDSNSCEEQN